MTNGVFPQSQNFMKINFMLGSVNKATTTEIVTYSLNNEKQVCSTLFNFTAYNLYWYELQINLQKKT